MSRSICRGVAALVSLFLIFIRVPVLAQGTGQSPPAHINLVTVQPVILSEAKNLVHAGQRPFAALRVTNQAERLGVSVAEVPVPSPRSAQPSAAPDPLIAGMMAQVQQSTVYSYVASLSGQAPIIVVGAPFTITTRNTLSGLPIDKAAQYTYEHLQGTGLTTFYDDWSRCGLSNRNVVAVLAGTVRPAEIVLLTAHLDDMPSSGLAPGADDNAAGSTGVLIAADILSRYPFERTVRFILFTGEEQGLCGSAAYAAEAKARGDDIRAVLNLDMIGYNSDSDPILDLYVRIGISGSMAIAEAFSQTVATYGLNLVPDIFVDYAVGNHSDNRSFWDEGYAAVLAIEDDDDFSPYYHTENDSITTLDMAYLTNWVKASVGTLAHLANPVFNPPDVFPSTATRAGGPGSIVTYTLQVSNTNPIADTFSVAAGGNAWPVTPTTPVGPVAGYASAPVTVTVLIPSSAWGEASDVVIVTVTSQADPAKSAASTLTTTAFYRVYLPMAFRN